MWHNGDNLDSLVFKSQKVTFNDMEKKPYVTGTYTKKHPHRDYDKRRVFKEAFLPELKELAETITNISLLARSLGVTPKPIEICISEKKHQEALKRNVPPYLHWRTYHDPVKHREKMRRYRARKKELGLINKRTGQKQYYVKKADRPQHTKESL